MFPGLIVSVPRTPEGLAQRTAAVLRENPVGVIHEWELTTRLEYIGIRDLAYAYQLPAFHRLSVPDRDVYSAMARLARHFPSPQSPTGYLELIEPDRSLRVASGPSIALGSKLDLSKGNHAKYLEALGVTDKNGARQTSGFDGAGVTVVVVDSGADPTVLKNSGNDFKDLVDDPPAAIAVDNLGHGTAMVQLVQAVAPSARVCAVRVFDTGDPGLSDVIAGIIAGLSQFNPDVVSLSLGFPDLTGPCNVCGALATNRSTAFRYVFDTVEKLAGTGNNPDPVFVAATGNDHPNLAMYFPAAYSNDSVLAIGAVNNSRERSAFSNYDKSPGYFAVLPGGDWDYQSNQAKEWVGEGQDAAGSPTYCVGTSPATAYAAGIMALYREQVSRRTAGGSTGGAPDVVQKAIGKCQQNLSPNYRQDEHGSGRLVFDIV